MCAIGRSPRSRNVSLFLPELFKAPCPEAIPLLGTLAEATLKQLTHKDCTS